MQSEATAFKGRLEKLVVVLLARRFKTLNDLWNIELELLALQRDIQAALTRRKSGPRLSLKRDLDALREALWHAKRFGDAFAWILFRNQRRSIYPLGENARVPVPPEGHSAQGIAAIAAELMGKGYLPFLHDITDVLRVGDITLFRPDETPLTVEVKTSLVSSEPARAGGTTHTYRVVATWPADGPLPVALQGDLRPGPAPFPASAAGRSDRFRRQLSRMTKAKLLSSAELGEDGKLLHIDGRPTLLAEARGAAGQSHWPLIRGLVRAARKTGFASGVAEEAVVYAAFYRKEAFDDPDTIAHLPELPKVLIASGILFEGDLRDKNSLIVSVLPDWHGAGPHLYMPYYLYALPRYAVVDLLHGRLILVSLLNLGRVAVALEEAGYRVELPTKDRDYARSPLRVFTETEVGSTRFRVELGGLHLPLTEMIMEARSPEYFVQWVRAAAQAAIAHAPNVAEDPPRQHDHLG